MKHNLRGTLLSKQQELLRTLKAPTQGVPVEELKDDVDHAAYESALDIDFALRTRNVVMIKKIDIAIEKIDNGQYGDCEDCGDPISERRLAISPDAELCVHCAEVSHRKGVTDKFNTRRSSRAVLCDE
jgi:DnaK suppressor protein